MRMRACGASPSAPWPFHCLVATRSRPAPSTVAAPHGMTSCCNMLQHHWLQDRAQAPMVCPFCRSKFRSFQNPAATYCLPHQVLPASAPTHQPVPPHAPHWPQEEPNPLHTKHNPPFPQTRRSPYTTANSLQVCVVLAIKMLTGHLRCEFMKIVYTNTITYKNNKQSFDYVYMQIICTFS